MPNCSEVHALSTLRPTNCAASLTPTLQFWFSACLSCLSCGVMMALLASRKDAATYTDTPF